MTGTDKPGNRFVTDPIVVNNPDSGEPSAYEKAIERNKMMLAERDCNAHPRAAYKQNQGAAQVVPNEKQLDKALEEAFKNDPDFIKWFLSKTKFANRNAKYEWSRSDYIWGTIPYPVVDPETNTSTVVKKQCETDVLLVVRAENGELLALHIENKIGTGEFTKLQPELYVPRAEHWKGNKKYGGGYTDYETVLVAPEAFREVHAEQAKIFGRFISHKEIAKYILLFGQDA